MTKRYAMLQKKLQELESQLSALFSLPADTPICHLQLVSESIKNRFLFLNNLLSTEIASAGPKNPPHLHLIATRLTELETLFRDWDEIRNSGIHILETDSICSCSGDESCLNDDGDGGEALPPEDFTALGFRVYDVPESFREAMLEDDEKEPEVETTNGDHRATKRDEKSKVGVVGKYIGALASGAMLGALMMAAAMVTFYDASQVIVYGGHHLVPT